MKKFILDTNVLIAHWRRRFTRPRKKLRPQDAARWAKELIRLHATDAIVTPIYVEMICGVTTEREARLTRVFLEQFRCVDEKAIPAQDWQNALRSAARVSGAPRDLGDCLIRAIADRLDYEVRTGDKGFPF